MKKFWAYISNGKYSVGTTGQTVYLFDKDGNELKRFKDIIYAYTPMFSPDGKLFVVKSTDGRLAVYSLETQSLIKKFRFSKVDGAQDDGFCFSPDSKYFINLESHGDDGLQWAISIYDASDFSIVSRLFLEDIALNYIEYDSETDEYYCMGCTPGVEDSNFIAKYKNNAVIDMRKYPEKDWLFNTSYMGLKMCGFTEKKYEWSHLEYELEELKDMNFSLAKLYNNYKNTWCDIETTKKANTNGEANEFSKDVEESNFSSDDDLLLISEILFDDDVEVSQIEHDSIMDEFYVLGSISGDKLCFYVAKYSNNTLVDKVYISEEEHNFYNSYIELKMMGFTEEYYECSGLEYELEKLKEMNKSLSELYATYKK